jgi:hypothetical protein
VGAATKASHFILFIVKRFFATGTSKRDIRKSEYYKKDSNREANVFH